VEKEVSTIFAGGGDGTIVDVINTLAELKDDAPVIPSVGVLRCGTGNALAHWLGSDRPVQALAKWQGGLLHRNVPVQMVEAEDTLFPFAGLGIDGAVLNDYNWLKNQAEGEWWYPMIRGIRGYLMSGYLKTIPNYLRREIPQVTVTNLGETAWRIGPDGRETGEPVERGEVLYQGPCSLLGTATTPLYGYGMRMFPYATRRAGRMQLRIFNWTALEAGLNLRKIWNGTVHHPRLHDFYVERVRVRFDDAMPYQLGGEASGYRREITFGVAEYPVNLVANA
jgi:diacylglycerol kinase family enzyme